MNCGKCSAPSSRANQHGLKRQRQPVAVTLVRTGDKWKSRHCTEEKYKCPRCAAIFWFQTCAL